MSEVIEKAKAEFLQAKAGLINALATTPDARINWSPSPTARSPLHVAAHAAVAVGAMLGNLKGETFAIETSAKAEQYFRNLEQKFSTREQVLELLEENADAYFAWLDEATPEILESMMKLPFGMGSMPVMIGISVMATHLNWHTAQLNYIQTIYGDHDWHLGI